MAELRFEMHVCVQVCNHRKFLEDLRGRRVFRSLWRRGGGGGHSCALSVVSGSLAYETRGSLE